VTNEEAISRLERNSMIVNDHNISCMHFYTALESMGATDLLDTVCFEGSDAQKMAQEIDEKLGIQTKVIDSKDETVEI
jgi:hypothetical protein